jgi:ABC-type sugar transport system permease subunit
MSSSAECAGSATGLVRRRARPGRRRSSRSQALWFLLPAILVLAGIDLGPMLYSLQASLTHWVLTDPGSENDPAGLSNYIGVLTSAEFWAAVRVTVTYAVCSVGGGLALGTAFALLLNMEFYGRSFFRSVMMIPMVITPVVIGIFWKLLYEQETGVFNWALSALGLPKVAWLSTTMALPSVVVMDVWHSMPFFMLVILAGLQSVDANLLEAARIDGAGRLALFRHIVLPHLLPYMLIAASFRLIATMNEFDKVWMLTGGGPGDSTTMITLYTFNTGFSSFDIGRVAAIAWIFVITVIVVSSPLLYHLFRVAQAER